MNQHIFPSENDHDLPIVKRFANICDDGQEDERKLVFTSSQNAALIQYKFEPGSSFIISVSHVPNPDRKPCCTSVTLAVIYSAMILPACNILMSSQAEEIVLKSLKGTARNCSLTTMLFPGKFVVSSMNIGGVNPYKNPLLENILCTAHGDYVVVGGSNDLVSSDFLESQIIRCDDFAGIGKVTLTLFLNHFYNRILYRRLPFSVARRLSNWSLLDCTTVKWKSSQLRQLKTTSTHRATTSCFAH